MLVKDKPTEFLNPSKTSNAKIVFAKIPHFEFLTQRFSLPAVNSNPANVSSPFVDYTRPGDKVQFQKPWTLEIILDEKYRSYAEIFSWFMSYVEYSNDSANRDFEDIVSDARIVLLDNEAEEVGSILFQDVYPIGLSSISYVTTDSSYEYIKFNADFDYSAFRPELI